MRESTATMDLEQFAELLRSDGYDIDDPAEAVTLAGYIVGPNIKRVASFLERPRSWVQEPARNLRHGGVWRGGKIAVDGENGLDGVTIALHTCVANGWMEMVDSGRTDNAAAGAPGVESPGS